MAATYIWGTGRRKKAVARVRLTPGTGKIEINGRPFDKYFCNPIERAAVLEVLHVAERLDKYDVHVTATGGGPSGQSGAVRLGIARALYQAEPGLATLIKQNRFLTRDPRMKERKKYGLHGARRGQQYSKR